MLVYLSLIPNLNVLGSSLGGVVHGEFSYSSSLKVWLSMAYIDNVCMTLLLKFVAVGVSFNTEFWLCVLNIVDIAL